MTVKIAIMLILAAAFVFALIYLKRQKTAKPQPANLKNSDVQTNIPKTVETPKAGNPKPEVTADAETTVITEAAQTTTTAIEAKITTESTQKTPVPVTESSTETLEAFAEEPMLRRHHLHNIRLMLEATTSPRPTDSVLSRHYDEMIEAKAEDCLDDEVKLARLIADYETCENAKAQQDFILTENSAEDDVAEEPMLKRHYLHNIRLMLEATTLPRPTDSVLSRHYEEMIDAKAEECLNDEAKLVRLIADYEACENAQLNFSTPVSILAPKHNTAIPEDSALRRHYLSTLRANIEKNKASRPSDSALRRHYDAMINAEIADYLA